MKNVRFFLLSLPLLGCAASQKDILKLERDLDTLRSAQAANTAEIDSIRADVRSLSGRVEEVEFRFSKGGPQLQELQRSLSTLQRRVPPPAIVPVRALEEDEGEALRLPEQLTPLLQEGWLKLRSAEFESAALKFREAVDISVGDVSMATALFWLGVASEGMADNRGALAAYHQLVTEFPKHRRAALALFRQGSVLIRLGDSATARVTFEKLIATLPKSEEARLAKERLKDLGK